MFYTKLIEMSHTLETLYIKNRKLSAISSACAVGCSFQTSLCEKELCTLQLSQLCPYQHNRRCSCTILVYFCEAVISAWSMYFHLETKCRCVKCASQQIWYWFALQHCLKLSIWPLDTPHANRRHFDRECKYQWHPPVVMVVLCL